MNADITVKVEGLTRKFGGFVAVDDINFGVRKGEVFGFLGPNGAGKSTTIKMLCGLLVPTSGMGYVGEHNIMTRSEEIKKNIGYMSQRFSLYEDLTVEENINFFSGIYGVASNRKKDRKGWVLEMAGLKDKRRSATKTLSGGVKQRLALGCAILHEPPILFLDEPTSGVDPVSRRNFWRLIYDMSKAGVTVFVTTHYMDEAEYCDRLALIYRGKIIAAGTPSELKLNYMKRKVFELSTDNVFETVDILEKKGIETAIFGSVLHVTMEISEREPLEKIKKILDGADIHAAGIEEIVPSLEDVFVTLIEVS
ncbi:MAG: ABC transporter ATP-binding protein [Deltaproteobacteria bacterium]|nr:ABC transporter ATP-binding protein [Deltaproteobacteria bacterium]